MEAVRSCEMSEHLTTARCTNPKEAHREIQICWFYFHRRILLVFILHYQTVLFGDADLARTYLESQIVDIADFLFGLVLRVVQVV
jgi:hypothetical protein